MCKPVPLWLHNGGWFHVEGKLTIWRMNLYKLMCPHGICTCNMGHMYVCVVVNVTDSRRQGLEKVGSCLYLSPNIG